jgi:hypothetical protein
MSFAIANLPNVSALTTALRTLEKDVGPVGSVILKMDKGGHWVFGADQTEVDDDVLWAVNPMSFVHGFIAWGEGEVLGESMVPVTEPRPEVGAAPPNAKKGWELQVGMSLKCLSGSDKDMEVRYTVTSVGGKRAVQELGVKIAAQIEKDQSKPVPVVRLKKEHYQHKAYGKIYTPLFDVVEWLSMDGKADEVEAEEAPAADAAPARRRRG